MDMNKILQNMDSAEKGTYKAGENDRSEMKTILESFYDVAEQDAAPQQLDEIASVTMSGDSADEVAQLVKLMNDAGAPEAAPVGAQPVSMPEPVSVDGPPNMPPKADMVTPKMMDDFESREKPVEEGDAKEIMHRKAERENREDFVADAGEMGMTAEEAGEFWDTTNGETESYENEPDERYDDHETMTHDLSGGLNRQKGSYADAEDGDNPMAVESKLRKELSKMLAQKMSEKKDQDKDGDNDFDDVKIARMKAGGMSHEEAVAKVKGDSDTKEDINVAEDDDPCWKNYKMVGTKKKNGKEVPNCVPKESATESSKKKEDEIEEGATDTKAKMKQIVSAFKPLTKGEKVVKAFSYKPGKEFASVPVIITENPKADEMYGPFASYIWTERFGEMSHSYYHPDLEDAVDHAKNEIKDDAEQGNLDPSIGQQRLPFEETKPKNNFVAKHAQKTGAGAHVSKKDKTGRKAKHKGKDMAMESPVFDTYIKPIINKTPKQMVEFYDSEARTIINRLSRERTSLAETNNNTKMHDVVIGRLRENLDAISEAPYGRRFRGRDSWDSNMPGYDPGGELGSRDYRSNEPDFRANDEREPEGLNNYAVYIGSKPWKVFRSQRQAEKAAATIKNKYGKDTKVFQTGAPATS